MGRPKIVATHDSVPSVGFVVHTVSGKTCTCLYRPLPAAVSTYFFAPRLMNSGVNRAAMIVPPSQGSTFSFLDAL